MTNLAALILVAVSAAPAKPHRVVVELNSPGKTAYNTVLGNLENLAKAFKPDPVEIEVVCHGDGIGLLAKTSGFEARMKKLTRQGVQFAACNNTIKGRHIDLNRLDPFIRVVPSGVAEVVKKEEAGWSYLKGGF